MIYDFQFKKLSQKDRDTLRINSRLTDQLLKRCPKKCRNPECKHPLPINDNYAIPEFGDVCELCYQMFQAVYQFPHFNALHQEWKKNQDKA